MNNYDLKKLQKTELEDSIDFVVLWVDCNDVNWQSEKRKYSASFDNDDSIIRYQDWDNLKYWFRSVEKYAPWVRKVHLVTNGQVPSWLNLSCSKLNLVEHSDYMPKDSLPTFNSSAIEVGIFNISELADKFVFFNDDMFLTSPITTDYYFHNGVPVDMEGFKIKPIVRENNVFSHLMKNNYDIICKHFNKKQIVQKSFLRWFRPWYGKTFVRTLRYIIEPEIPGFIIPHLSTPYLKSDFEKVWSVEHQRLTETQYNRFRSTTDLTHFLFRNWRMCEGTFVPRKSKGKYFSVENVKNAEQVESAILKSRYPEICINETCSGELFEQIKKIVNSSFETVLSEKSDFEK